MKPAGSRNRCLRTLLFAAAILFMASCSEPGEEASRTAAQTDKVVLAVSRSPLSSPFYIARELGYFAAEGLEAQFLDISGGHKCLKAMLEGEADLATSSELPIMFNSFARDDFVIIATFATSYNDVKIMARRDENIRAAADLAGRKIGVIPGSASQFFFDFYLLLNGVRPESVSIQKMEPEQMVRALESGEVDGVSIWEPYGYESLKILAGLLYIFPHEKLYRETFNLTVKRSFAEKNPEIPEKILRALARAVAYMEKHEEESRRIIAAELAADKGFIDWIWPDFAFGLQLDQELIMTLEDEAKWAIDNKLVDGVSAPNFFSFIHLDPMLEVHPRGITLIHNSR